MSAYGATRFDRVEGRPLVALPPFRLEDRRVELLVPGEAEAWVTLPALDEAAESEINELYADLAGT